MFELTGFRSWRRWRLTLLALIVAGLLTACAAARPIAVPTLASGTPVSPPATVTLEQTVSTETPAMMTEVRPTAPHTPAPPAPEATIVPPTLPATPTVTAPTTVVPSATPTTTPRQAAFRPEVVKLSLEMGVGGLNAPVFATHAGDGSGRLFIVEKPGVIRIWEAGELHRTPFLDIRERVGSRGSEQELLGLAFAPDYVSSRAFFVNYTDRQGNTVVARFTISADPDAADPSSEVKLLEIAQPAANHNGGMLAFGPDGYLYIGTGDGGGANDQFGNGQNPGTLLGKLLRLDVTSDPTGPYRIPAGNPWVNKPGVRDEIWALGLRNPWRFSFDRQTGDLWIGDVGQNRYEEVDLAPGAGGQTAGRGLNFGWSVMEGTHCFPDTVACDHTGLTLPVIDYAHGSGDCSITGGYIYRGQQFPALTGAYLYGDYCSGRIWALDQDPTGGWRGALLLDSDLAISSFGEDEAGELFVLDLSRGGLYRVTAQTLSRNYLPLWASLASSLNARHSRESGIPPACAGVTERSMS